MLSVTRPKSQRGAILIHFTLLLPTVLIPLIGLGIDATMCYIVQAKLGSAVDGAALGAGRLLGVAPDPAALAGQFLDANFRADGTSPGFWRANTLRKTVVYTPGIVRTISIDANVQVPLLFARIFGQSYAVVSASGMATRRDARIVMVLDQSGSMSTDITNVKAGAAIVAGTFSPGIDEMGMVVFSGSSIVAYPIYTLPYDSSSTSTTQRGPDKNFATSSTEGPIFDQINTITSGGATNASEALSMAYIELVKAHNRDAAGGTDQLLNAIIFFTDGMSTAISVSPNNPSNNSLKPYGTGAGQSPCTWNPSTTNAASKMKGYVGFTGSQPGGTKPWSSSTPQGLKLLRAYSTAYTSTSWLSHGLDDWSLAAQPTTATANCANLDSASGSIVDLQNIPSTDYYGNSTNNPDYALGKAYDSPCNVAYDPTKTDKACHWGLAMWNTTDNVGKTIRSLAAMGTMPAPTGMLPITIYTIGFNRSTNDPVDPVLLKRLANTTDSTSYSGSQPGQYIQVETPEEIPGAFSTVAWSILRLAK
jgi:Flp pilus assembly protein TadG